MKIPRIPESKMAFGDADWIACKKAVEDLPDFISLAWMEQRRNKTYKGEPPKEMPCEACELPIEPGKTEYSRGNGKWLHKACLSDAEKFISTMKEITQ